MKLAPDKWRHIFAGFFIGLVLPLIGYYMFDLPMLSNYFLSLFGLMLISYGFEVFSFVSGKGHYDMVDAVVTVLGGLPGLALSGLFL